MNQVLKERVTHQLEMLPDDAIERVLKFITSLGNRKLQGIPGSKLMKFAGTIKLKMLSGKYLLDTNIVIPYICR